MNNDNNDGNNNNTINSHLPVNEQLTNVLIALHPFSHIIHTIILGVGYAFIPVCQRRKLQLKNN